MLKLLIGDGTEIQVKYKFWLKMVLMSMPKILLGGPFAYFESIKDVNEKILGLVVNFLTK